MTRISLTPDGVTDTPIGVIDRLETRERGRVTFSESAPRDFYATVVPLDAGEALAMFPDGNIPQNVRKFFFTGDIDGDALIQYDSQEYRIKVLREWPGFNEIIAWVQ